MSHPRILSSRVCSSLRGMVDPAMARAELGTWRPRERRPDKVLVSKDYYFIIEVLAIVKAETQANENFHTQSSRSRTSGAMLWADKNCLISFFNEGHKVSNSCTRTGVKLGISFFVMIIEWIKRESRNEVIDSILARGVFGMLVFK